MTIGSAGLVTRKLLSVIRLSSPRTRCRPRGRARAAPIDATLQDVDIEATIQMLTYTDVERLIQRAGQTRASAPNVAGTEDMALLCQAALALIAEDAVNVEKRSGAQSR